MLTSLRAVQLAVLALALVLTACGGGTQSSPTTAPTTGSPAAAPTLAPAAPPAATTSPLPAGASPVAQTSPAAASSPAPAAASPAAAASPSPAASPAAGGPVPTAMAKASPGSNELGSAQRPIRMAFIPSADSQRILASGKPLGDLLGQETGYTFDVSVPTNYSAVIEAMGADNIDVAWLAPFSYSLAHKKYGADVILTAIRQGSRTYRAQIITQADSGIKTLQDLRGKRFAFVDAVSASGYLYPSSLLQDRVGFDPKNPRNFFSEVVFAGGHDKVVLAVYNKQVDAGATYGNSNPNAEVSDARTTVRSTVPDVMEKVVPIAETDPIPNDTVSVRKGLPPEMVQRLTNGLLRLQTTQQGRDLLKALYGIDGLEPATDADYASLRAKADSVGIDLEEAVAPARPATPSPSPAAR